MCVLELSTLRVVREGPLSDVSRDSLVGNLWPPITFSSTAMSDRVHLWVSLVVSPARPLLPSPARPRPVEAQSAACAVPIKALIKETMISAHI